MSTTSVTSVLREIYSAPLDAAVRAEEQYRRIWAEWLEAKRSLVVQNNQVREGVNLAELLNTAPVVRLDGRMDIAITMRIASVRGTEAGGQVGLAVGPIHASGSFGFVDRTTQESVLQASTVVVLSNTEQNLVEYLSRHGIANVADPADLDQAIALLRTGNEPAGG